MTEGKESDLKKEAALEQLAKDIFKEQNILRTNPQIYIEKLIKASNLYKDKIFRHPMEIPIETYEGVEGIKKAIEFLKKQEPVKELVYSEELSKAAKDHAVDIGAQGSHSHEGSDNSLLSDRIERYTEWDGAIAESLQFCYKIPENIIMSLIIDDGSKEKHQRENLFSTEFEYVGIACNSHKTFKLCSVFVYAKNLYPIGDEPPERIDFDQNALMNYKNSDKPLNPFKKDDPYAPDNTVDVKIVKLQKTFNNEQHNITRKIFSLDDGKKHIVDYEEKEKE